MNHNRHPFTDRPLTFLLLVLLVIAILVRLLGLRYRLNSDLVHFVIPWTQLIDEKGLIGLYEGISRQADWALGLLAKGAEGLAGIHGENRPVDVNYNYTPFYSYLLSMFGVLPFSAAVRAKLISITFDVAMACGLYRIVRRNAESRFEPRLAFSLALLLPTVFLNSSWWGQMDAIFTSFLVWAVFFLLEGRNRWACFLGGIALGVKFQPLFFAPVLLPLLLLRRLRLRDLAHGVTGYISTFVPALLMGYPASFVLLRHGASFLRSSHHWALGATAYAMFEGTPPAGATNAFLLVCVVLIVLVSALVYALHSRHPRGTGESSSKTLTDADILEYAVFFTVLTVFFLPSMHERYFYVAEVIALALAFYDRRRWYVPIALQMSGVLSYMHFLFSTSAPIAFASLINALLLASFIVPLVQKVLGIRPT